MQRRCRPRCTGPAATSLAAVEGHITIVGHRWARHSHEVKDFLGRNRIPFIWLDLDHGRKAAAALANCNLDEAALPALIFPDGSAMADPSIDELANKLEMHTRAEHDYYDLVVVGAGPAGLAAAVYGASEGLSTAVIESEAPGGQAGTSSRIENYLGFPEGVSGAELAERALTQAERLGAEVIAPAELTELELNDHFKTMRLSNGASLTSRALIVASGVTYRELGAPGLGRLAGAGVYYGAATTEAITAKGEHVYTVGSANSAGQGAMYFSKFANKVTMLVRGPGLEANMSQYLIDQITSTPNIEVRTECRVTEATGKDHLETITIEASTGTETVPASFLFIFIGAEPRHPWLPDSVACDDQGYILTGPDVLEADSHMSQWPLQRHPFHLESSVPGIFAAGDVRHGSIRRVAGAVGEGSTAVQLVHRYLAQA